MSTDQLTQQERQAYIILSDFFLDTELIAVDKAVDQGIPDSAKPRMTAFAG
jgi:hypothetical protein